MPVSSRFSAGGLIALAAVVAGLVPLAIVIPPGALLVPLIVEAQSAQLLAEVGRGVAFQLSHSLQGRWRELQALRRFA